MRDVTRGWRADGSSIGLVPTMGALHAGHMSLVEAARLENDRVAVSVFVNPIQFGPGEDLARYPRSPERDLSMLTAAGVDAVYKPSVADMYPPGASTRVTKALRIPTIGIGAGPGTDGQVLVYHDMLGLTTGKAPKFVKRYANLAEEIARAAQTYAKEVGDGTFPGPEHSYSSNGSSTPAKPKLDEVKYGSSV